MLALVEQVEEGNTSAGGGGGGMRREQAEKSRRVLGRTFLWSSLTYCRPIVGAFVSWASLLKARLLHGPLPNKMNTVNYA